MISIRFGRKQIVKNSGIYDYGHNLQGAYFGHLYLKLIFKYI